MKKDKKEEARKLRQKGLSVNEITQKLGVSKSSVSIWVRDISLTPEQIENLNNKNPFHINSRLGSIAMKNKFKDQRKSFQEEGKEMALNNGMLFSQGCMLYWGEGSKNRNSVQLCNSDPYLLRLFKNFLIKHFNIKEEEISLYINCYTGNGISVEEIQEYWISILKLDKSNLRKTRIDQYPNSSKKTKKGKLPYGTCCLTVNRTDVLQKIYGAIQFYGGFIKDSWIE